MSKKILFIFTLVFVLSALVFPAAAKEKAGRKKKIVIATDATWPPMEYVDEKTKEIIGFDVDLMKAVAQAAGFEAVFKNTAWDGIFAGLAANKYDAVMSSVTITDERKKEMDFSKPYINAGQVLVVAEEMEGVTALEDLVGMTVGAQIGTTGAFAVEKVKGVGLKTYDEIGLAYEDLVNGRIEGVVADTPVAANFALQNAEYKGKLKIVGEPFTEEYYGIAVKKGNAKVLDLINKGLDKVLGTQQVEDLKVKWLR